MEGTSNRTLAAQNSCSSCSSPRAKLVAIFVHHICLLTEDDRKCMNMLCRRVAYSKILKSLKTWLERISMKLNFNILQRSGESCRRTGSGQAEVEAKFRRKKAMQTKTGMITFSIFFFIVKAHFVICQCTTLTFDTSALASRFYQTSFAKMSSSGAKMSSWRTAGGGLEML